MYLPSRGRSQGLGQTHDPYQRQQVASSLVDTRNAQAMHDFLRMSSSREEGWLEIDFSNKSYNLSKWQRCWVVFDYNNSSGGMLDISVAPDGENILTVPMASVLSFKTDNISKAIKLLTTGDQKLILRADNPEEMKRWLFTFQKSVALVLSMIIESNDKPWTNRNHKGDSVALHGHPSTIFTNLPTIPNDESYNNSSNNSNNSYNSDNSNNSNNNKNSNNNDNDSNSSIFSMNNNDDQFSAILRRQSLNRTTSVPNDNFERRKTFVTIDLNSNFPISSPSSSSSDFYRQISIDSDMQQMRSAHKSGFNRPTTSSVMMSSSFHATTTGYTSPPIAISKTISMQNELPLARSPIIPIILNKNNSISSSSSTSSSNNINNYSSDNNMTKVAGSYVEPDLSKSVLESAMELLVNDNKPNSVRRDSISSDASQENSPIDTRRNDSDVMFEMDGFGLHDNASFLPNIKPSTIPSSKRNLTWESGSCSLLGKRKSNEDRFVREDSLSITSSISSPSSLDKNGYYAVYDGHTGDDAAVYLQENLHQAILNHPLYESNIVKAIEEACCEIDQKFLDICRQRKKEPGSTALGVFLRKDEFILFNIGDSCAVLCTDGVAEEIMQAHKPNRPDEQERILKANGWITEEKELYLARLHMMNVNDPWIRSKAEKLGWVVIHRICGEIAVSRSIGDPIYKNFNPGEKVLEYFAWPEGHTQIFMADLVIPLPECKVISITQKHDFFIVASDGLWDVVSPQEAIDRVKLKFQDGKSCNEAAEALCELAIQLGSSDNVTVVIVKFIHSKI